MTLGTFYADEILHAIDATKAIVLNWIDPASGQRVVPTTADSSLSMPRELIAVIAK